MNTASVLSLTFLAAMLAAALRFATPLLLAALGEIFTERSGILNLGLEGVMLSGAFVGFVDHARHRQHAAGISDRRIRQVSSWAWFWASSTSPSGPIRSLSVFFSA